jgi:signal transduction histidine kinase
MLCLTVVGIGAAGRAGFHLRAQSGAVREKQALDDADAAVESLVVGALAGRASGAKGSDPAFLETKQALAEMATQVLAPLFEAAGGFCDTEGTLIITTGGGSRFDWPTRTGAPQSIEDDRNAGRLPSPAVSAATAGNVFPVGKGERIRPLLLPADRDALVAACRAAKSEHTDHKRVSLPHDLLMFSLRGTTDRLVAWTMIRLPPADTNRLGIELLAEMSAVAVATLAFVLVALGALVALRRGAAELHTGLSLLEGDLHAEIPVPRIRELKLVATGLKDMANHLAETQERERTLAAQLGHEQQLAALGRVAAGVAHEVRNPLTGIKLTLDNMARRRLDDRSAEDVAICRQEIARLDRVVSSLLLVARKGPLEVSRLDASKLVDERIEAAQALAAKRNVRLLRDGQCSILANRDAMTRIIDNLLRNGIEASPEGGEVRVELRNADTEMRMRVVDGGAGVLSDRVPELFEPFFTLKPEGTGLGLFVSRSLLEAQGGTLTYDRREGLTCFCATVPADART